ncbi:DinB family protein [Candidatus Jorgensenbacteria bacterium]|nr:DinB family protein [Candidatus Jorgensenbacteria bacterium]
MNEKEMFLGTRKHEFETSARVLQAYPEDKADMRPAEKSRTAKELVGALAMEEGAIMQFIKNGRVDMSGGSMPKPASMADAIKLWQKSVSENNQAIEKLSDTDFNKNVDFFGTSMPLNKVLWTILMDHIHHRGQFSVYLRIAGGKVPPIYGPTADYP